MWIWNSQMMLCEVVGEDEWYIWIGFWWEEIQGNEKSVE